MNLRDIIFLLFIVDEINAARGRLKKASRVINRNINKAEEMMVNAVNGTDFTLDCSSARNFVRTHMAPDFENPQLVRRLDWFHDGTLVASYQQDIIFDTSQQWWVAGARYELRRPFFELRISPLLPHDSGLYRCHMETDPLFSDSDFASGNTLMDQTLGLNVLVKPTIPSKPVVSQHTISQVNLQWNSGPMDPIAATHQPILRYSILAQSQVDGNRILTTDDNRTMIRIDGLKANTEYTFSVRAENKVGESGFGPTNTFKTIGLPPKNPPKIIALRNTSKGCIEIEWTLILREKNANEEEEKPVNGFRILLYHPPDDNDAIREMTIKSGTVRRQSLCNLKSYSYYGLSIESDNGFGYSTKTMNVFKTDQDTPSTAPAMIGVKAIPGHSRIQISWHEPQTTNGVINSYQIYYAEQFHQQPTLIQINLQPSEKHFVYNLTKLAPTTTYKIQLSASTIKGEGPLSDVFTVTTDISQPRAPQITNLTYQCSNGLMEIEWRADEPLTSEFFFRVSVDSKQTVDYNTTGNRLLIDKLQPLIRHSIRVFVLAKSLLDNQTIIEGISSRPEFLFIPKAPEGKDVISCTYKSSFCPPLNEIKTTNCELLRMHSANTQDKHEFSSSFAAQDEPNTNNSFLFLILSICTILVILVFVIWLFKRKCLVFKSFLKRAEKHSKAVNGLEIISLVDEPSPDDAEYGETVTVLQFDGYYERMSENDNDGFRKQFVQIEMESQVKNGSMNQEKRLDEDEANSEEENRLKNRYLNVSAFSHSRIRITGSNDGSDGYINANYIDSCDEKKAYIATQAPMPSTFADFWQMVWQEKSAVIVMITNLVESGRRKCDQYWPELPKSQMTVGGKFLLTLDATFPNMVFVHRVIRISLLNSDMKKGSSRESRSRIVHQVHFTGWPDHGIPSTPYPLLYFLNYVADIQTKHDQQHAKGPCIVHCSAGVGRSGAFILIDSMRRHLLRCDRINVQAHLRRMRKQRFKLVQTTEQYVFCFTVLRHLIANGITRQPITNFPNYINFLFNQRVPTSGNRRIEAQFKDLCSCTHEPNQLISSNGYVILPGYHQMEEYIVSSHKLESSELWDLVWKRKCQTIFLILDGVNDDPDPTIPIRLPPELTNQNRNTLTRLPQRTRKIPPLRFAPTKTPNGNIPNPDLMTRSAIDIGITNSMEESELKAVVQRSNANVLLKKNGDELCVRIVRVRGRAIEENTWTELERIQNEVLHHHQITMVIDERGSTSTSTNNCHWNLPFILCVLQSLACQIEQECALDVLLFLALYQQKAGCWSTQKDIECIYRKVLQLVLLKNGSKSK